MRAGLARLAVLPDVTKLALRAGNVGPPAEVRRQFFGGSVLQVVRRYEVLKFEPRGHNELASQVHLAVVQGNVCWPFGRVVLTLGDLRP